MISTGIKNDETLLKSRRFASNGFISGKVPSTDGRDFSTDEAVTGETSGF